MSLLVNSEADKKSGTITKAKTQKVDVSYISVSLGLCFVCIYYLKGLFDDQSFWFSIFHKVHTRELTGTDSHSLLSSLCMLFIFSSSNIFLVQFFKEFFKLSLIWRKTRLWISFFHRNAKYMKQI